MVATNEEHAIAQETVRLIRKHDAVSQEKKIPIVISARYIHLTQQAVDAFFGPGYQLTKRNDLSQPGQYACQETLTVVGPKNSLERVRILGPLRKANQVEISRAPVSVLLDGDAYCGEIQVEASSLTLEMEALVEALVEEVVQVVTDWDRLGEVLGDKEDFEVKEHYEDGALIHRQKKSTLLPSFWFLFEIRVRQEGQTTLLEVRRRDGTLEHFEELWTFSPQDGITRIHRISRATLPVVPPLFLLEGSQRTNAEKMVEGLRTRMGKPVRAPEKCR